MFEITVSLRKSALTSHKYTLKFYVRLIKTDVYIMFTVVHVDVIQAMEFLQNIEGERAGHAKGEVVDEHSISEAVRARSLCLLQLL